MRRGNGGVTHARLVLHVSCGEVDCVTQASKPSRRSAPADQASWRPCSTHRLNVAP